MRLLASACALLVLAAQSGCGQAIPAWRLPDPPGEEIRRGIGRLAVVLEAGASPGFPEPPVAGSCTLAGLGALGGAGVGLGIGLVICSAAPRCVGGDPFTALVAAGIVAVGLAVAAVATPLGALIGTAEGASRARPAEEIEAGRRVLETAAARTDVPALLRAGLLEELRRETRVRLVEPDQADTLLLVGAPLIALAGPLRADPPLTVFGQVRFRLRRVSDRKLLHEITLGFHGRTQNFDRWVAEDGVSLRSEILAGTSGFAARAVEELFLLEAAEETAR